MAVHVGFVMDAAFMGEAVSTESNFPILSTAASSALVWYYHTAGLIADYYSNICFYFFLILQITHIARSGLLMVCGKYQNLGQKYRILSRFHIHTLFELLTNGLEVSPHLSAHTCRHRNRASPDGLHPQPQLPPPHFCFYK